MLILGYDPSGAGDGDDALRGQGFSGDRLIGGAGIDRMDGGGGADILTRDADDIVVEDCQNIVIAELNAAFSVSDDWMEEV